MKSTGLWQRKPTTVTVLEDVENVHIVKSQTRRQVAGKLQGKLSNTASHCVTAKSSNIDGENSNNDRLLNSLFGTLKAIGLKKRNTLNITRDIRSFLYTLDNCYITRLTIWKDDDGLDIVHICIIANAVNVLHTLFSNDFIPKTHQPAICPYAHFSTMLNRPDCLRVVLINRPDDHFKLLDPIMDKLPPYILGIETAITTDDKILSARMTCLLAQVRTCSKTTADELNIPAEVMRPFVQGQNAFSNNCYTDKKTSTPRRSTFGQRRKQGNFKKRLTTVDSSTVSFGLSDDDVNSVVPSKKSSNNYNMTDRAPKGKHRITLHNDDDVYEASPINDVGVRVSVRNPRILPPLVGAVDKTESVQDHRQKETTPTEVSVLDPCDDAQRWLSLRRNSLYSQRNKKRLSVFNSRVDSSDKLIIEADENQNAVDSRCIGHNNIFLKETPMSIAFKQGFSQCIKIILQIIVAKQYGISKEYPLLTATKTNSPLAIMVLCGCNTISFRDFQAAVLLALRQHRVECCKLLLSHNRHGEFRRKLFGGDNLFHVLYNGNSAQGSSVTKYLPKMTSVLIEQSESVINSKRGQYPLYSLIVSAFNDDSVINQNQFITCFLKLLEAGADPCFREKSQIDHNPHSTVSRNMFSSVFDCMIKSAQTSRFLSDETDSILELLNRFCVEIYNHSANAVYTWSFGGQNLTVFSYMALAVKFEVDIDIIQVFLRLGCNPMQKHNGFYAINYYFQLLFPYLERYEVENCTEFYSLEVEKLMYLCRKMSLTALKDAMVIFLDYQMVGIPCQGVFAAKYFCHLVGQMLTSPRSLRDACALTMWHTQCNRKEKIVEKLDVSDAIKRRILP